MKHQDKNWLYEQYFTFGKSQIEIAALLGIKQVTVSKWLNIFFTKEELKKTWHYGKKGINSGESHWTKKHPMHPFIERIKEGIRKGAIQSNSEKEKRGLANKGQKRSQEVKKVLSEGKKGDKNPQTKMRGELSHFWNPEKTQLDRIKQRKHIEYIVWRKGVYERDNYTCQKCFAACGNGSKVVLNAHHIENYSTCMELRHSLKNGITLCKDCHTSFHKKYSRKNNTLEQLNEFLK